MSKLLVFLILSGAAWGAACSGLAINPVTGLLDCVGASSAGGVTSIGTTSPLTGGTITTSGTIACATCVTSAAALTNNAIMTGAGSQASKTPAATATMDTSGNISTPGGYTAGAGSSVAGGVDLGQGTATAAATASVGFQGPATVTTKFRMTLPAAPATGLMLNTGTSDPSTISFGALSGDCTTASLVVTCQKVNGIAHSATQAAHTVEVVTTADTTATAKVMPDCTDTGGNHLNFTQSTDAFSCGTSGASGGLTIGTTAITNGTTTRVLYDNAGTLGEYVVSGTGSVCMTITCVMTSTLTNTQGTLAGASTPAYTHTATWNNGATNFVDDFRNITKTAAASPSYLIQWQVGGSNIITLDTNGTLVTGLGISAGSTITSGFNLNAASGAQLCVLNSTCFDAPSNGVMRISNNGQTDFTRLQLGGTTSSFPSIKRSGTTTAFRLADDSADSPITASGATLSGATVVLSGLGTASGTPDSVCLNTNTLVRNAALTCTVSSRDFKIKIAPLAISATRALMNLKPSQFAYRDRPERLRFGFISEEVASVDGKLADGYDKGGIARSLDQNAILALAVKTIQEQQQRIEALEAKLGMQVK